jgi:hypothetical protein
MPSTHYNEQTGWCRKYRLNTISISARLRSTIGRMGDGWTRQWEEAQRNLARGLHTSKLAVYGSNDKTARIPQDPALFERHVEFNRAAEFTEVLNEYIAEQEAESGDDLEEV